MVERIHYLTAEGFVRLERQFHHLVQVRRVQITDRLRALLEEGMNLEDNAEFLDAKREQAFIEGEIARLEAILNHAQIIETGGNHNHVRLGSMVTLVEHGCQQHEDYLVVDSAEASPRDGKISVESPLGSALMGTQVGDRVVVEAPDGKVIFVVKAIQ